MTTPVDVDHSVHDITSAHGQSETGQAAAHDWRAQLVLDHLYLARRLANRYSGRGEPVDELVQVAMVGLVQAANRFDPDRGSPFTAYAVPTILGELRRHFRDYCWSVHIPRPLHDLYHAVLQANDRLTGKLQRTPTVRELAAHLDVGEDQIVQAQESASAYSALSLDVPASADGTDSDSLPLRDLLGSEDTALDRVEQREAVRDVLAEVPPREAKILTLWFFGDRTQAQIAEEMGMSQMHVSRLLAMTLANIRSAVLDENHGPIRWPSPRQRRKAS
ncbi:SigB/SigF/SigG family RNA polymerase sigma factor [Actinopolymorpha sp. B17G11]|uniref:SigB/SigF/SigG family RNA polymerase sigma factor n=1 Tax=Actinopolymorpha sp. B17G11 TaxID=3160861 RepID=UPI0032E4FD35